MTAPRPLHRTSVETTAHPGKSSLRFESVRTDKLAFTATTTCVSCGRSLVVRLGTPSVVFRIGKEFVGLVCDACLSPDSRNRLAELRSRAEGQVTP